MTKEWKDYVAVTPYTQLIVCPIQSPMSPWTLGVPNNISLDSFETVISKQEPTLWTTLKGIIKSCLYPMKINDNHTVLEHSNSLTSLLLKGESGCGKTSLACAAVLSCQERGHAWSSHTHRNSQDECHQGVIADGRDGGAIIVCVRTGPLFAAGGEYADRALLEACRASLVLGGLGSPCVLLLDDLESLCPARPNIEEYDDVQHRINQVLSNISQIRIRYFVSGIGFKKFLV